MPATVKPQQQSSDPSHLRTTAILVGVIVMLYVGREILIPLAFAITLTLVLTPAVALLQRMHFGRMPAVILVMTVLIGVSGGIGWVIFNQLIDVINELPRYQQNIHNKIEAMRTSGRGAFGRAAQSVQELGKELTSPHPPAIPAPGRRNQSPQPGAPPMPVQVVNEPVSELEYLRELSSSFLGPLAILGIVLIFTVFLLFEQADLRNRLFRLVGIDRMNVMTQALDDATQRVSRYLMLQLIVNVCFAIVSGVGLFLIGVPYAALWGVVAGLLRLVPYIGIPVAGMLPLALSLAVFDGWLRPTLVFLLFATIEILTANFIEPWLYGIHTGISSLALLLTAVFWTTLWGPAGLILSTPLTVCVVVLGRYFPQLSFLHVLLGDEPVLEPEAQIYQRLLSMDEEEARAVAERYLSENSLVQLYDSVIVPTLTMAEQDRHKGALEPAREQFLFLSVREMLAEFSERTIRAEADIGDPALKRTPVCTGRVFCIPTSDEADEITASMLAQLLEQAGCTAVSFPLDSSAEHMLSVMAPETDDIFCISALPPFAFARARNLCRQLRDRYPRTRIVIGVWGFAGDAARAIQRFQPCRPDKLVTRLADAVAFVVVGDVAPVVEEPMDDSSAPALRQ